MATGATTLRDHETPPDGPARRRGWLRTWLGRLGQGLGDGGEDRVEVRPGRRGGANISAGRLRQVPAVLEDLVEDLGRRQAAAQAVRDRDQHRVVDLLQPAVRRDRL